MVINIIMLALFIEAIVAAVKPLWKDGGKGMSVTEIVSIAVGIVIAVALRIDLFSAIIGAEIIKDAPPFMAYVFYVMSGVAIGRGPSFVADLWKSFKKWGDFDIAEGMTLEEVKNVEQEYSYNIDLNIENWSVARLREFCILNDIPAEGCVTKEEYINAIERGGRVADKPPDE